MNSKAVLIIGASGRTGFHLIKQLNNEKEKNNNNIPENLKIFGFCRSPSKLDVETKALCDGVIEGNARNVADVEAAVKKSKADIVVVAIGNGDNVKKSDIRTSSAEALVKVLNKQKYRNVKVVLVSSIGAGESRIKYKLGIGRMIEFHLRHILRDHDGQEAAFKAAMKDRVLIVRPTALSENESTGKTLIPFGDLDKCPTLQTDRQDLANWLINEGVFRMEGTKRHFGSKPINLTTPAK